MAFHAIIECYAVQGLEKLKEPYGSFGKVSPVITQRRRVPDCACCISVIINNTNSTLPSSTPQWLQFYNHHPRNQAYTHQLRRQDVRVRVQEGTDISFLGPQKWKNQQSVCLIC